MLARLARTSVETFGLLWPSPICNSPAFRESWFSLTQPTKNQSAKYWLLHAVCAASGAAGLGLQLTWTRRLSLGLGHELPATLAVVTAFFAGLALGAALLDKWLRQTANPARGAAFIELAIGVWAVISIPLLPWVNEIARLWIGIDASPTAQWSVCFALPLAALLPATMAMGATLAAMERTVAKLAGGGSWIPGLYAANTAGAVAGVASTVWWLNPGIGFRASTSVWAAVDLICGAALLVLQWRTSLSPTSTPKSAESRSPARAKSLNEIPKATHAITIQLAVTGLLGVGFEVVAVRLLAMVLEGTVYTYASILICWLIGTALGAALVRNRQLPTESLIAALPAVLLIGGLCLGATPAWFEALRRQWGDSASAVTAAELTIAGAVVLPASLLMGALFSRLVQQGMDRGMGAGRAIAWNTLGAALAPIIIGVALFPSLGGKWTLIALASGYAVLLARQPRWFAPSLAAAGLFIFALPVNLRLFQAPPGARLVEFREGPSDSVAVYEQFGNHLTLAVDNRFIMGGTASTNAAARHSHLPLLLHPAPARALFLGLGTGISFAAMGAHPGLTADGVELVAEVVAIQPRFAPYNDLGPGLLRHTADARRFVRNAGSKYDVVVADLFHPARDGAGSLYTVDHYAAIRGLLDERGLACQWLPLYQLDAPTLQSIVRSFMAVFSNTHAFLLRPNVDTPVLGLVGWVSQPSFGPSWWDRRATNFALQDKLKTAGLGDGYQCFGTWLAGPAQLRAYADGAPLNTDDSLYVQYSAPRAAWRQNAPHSALLLDLLDRFAGEGAEFPCQATDLKARQWLAHLADFRAARDDYLRGAVADDAGRKPEAEQLYLTSAHRSPDFTTAYATLLTRAMAQARENPTEARRILSALIAARPERPIASDLLKRMEGL